MGHVDQRADLDEMKRELAAAFRLAAMFELHEGIDNHFSYAVDAERFLLNPFGIHWSMLRAGDMILTDGDGNILEGEGEIEITALHIHGGVHRSHPDARAVLHTHMPYSTAITCQEGGRLEPVSQTAAQFNTHIAYDDEYSGLGDNREEGDRLADAMGGKPILFMGNHGILTTGATIGIAFHLLYHVERSARLQVLASTGGRPLRTLPESVVATTGEGWGHMPYYAEKHMSALRALLDRDQPEYAEL